MNTKSLRLGFGLIFMVLSVSLFAQSFTPVNNKVYNTSIISYKKNGVEEQLSEETLKYIIYQLKFSTDKKKGGNVLFTVKSAKNKLLEYQIYDNKEVICSYWNGPKRSVKGSDGQYIQNEKDYTLIFKNEVGDEYEYLVTIVD